jgi:hypothetical protein
MKRKPNFIDKLPNDKKGHLILGLLINPFVFGVLHNNPLDALIVCLLIHGSIEIYQHITNTGKAELLDFAAGSYSALVIYVLTELIK